MKAFAEDTGGALGFVEFVHPAGEKINSHVHLRSDEFFYVLEGQCTFRLGEESQLAGPGSFVFVPRGTTHSYSVGESGGKVVFGFIPGGTEGFFPWVVDARERDDLTDQDWMNAVDQFDTPPRE